MIKTVIHHVSNRPMAYHVDSTRLWWTMMAVHHSGPIINLESSIDYSYSPVNGSGQFRGVNPEAIVRQLDVLEHYLPRHNGVPDQRFSRRRSRPDDTLERKGVSVKIKILAWRLLAFMWSFYSYDRNPLLNSGLSLMTVPWSSTGGSMS